MDQGKVEIFTKEANKNILMNSEKDNRDLTESMQLTQLFQITIWQITWHRNVLLPTDYSSSCNHLAPQMLCGECLH